MFTHEAGAVLAECGLHICGLSESVDETHLAVKQRAGFHEVFCHLFPADLPVPVGGERARDEASLKKKRKKEKLVNVTAKTKLERLTGSCPVLQTC